jgi:ketosteroid isomerase-like protein
MTLVRLPAVLIVCLALVACAGPDAVPARDPISPDALESAQAVRSLLERNTAAWEKSADAVLALYADDVRFTDLLAGWQDEPRATLEQMVREYVGIPGLGGSPSSYFVDATGGVDSYDGWGLGDSTEANPIHEVDVFETGDGLLTSMHTVYDVRSLAHIIGRPVADLADMQSLIQGYADAWSSGEPSSVAERYAEEASRTDALWGDSAEGRQAISDAAARWFTSYPGAVWQVDTVFGDGPGEVMNGGLFTVRLAEPDACDLGAAVVLEMNEAQKIVTERVYWELDSLIRCGMA